MICIPMQTYMCGCILVVVILGLYYNSRDPCHFKIYVSKEEERKMLNIC